MVNDDVVFMVFMGMSQVELTTIPQPDGTEGMSQVELTTISQPNGTEGQSQAAGFESKPSEHVAYDQIQDNSTLNRRHNGKHDIDETIVHEVSLMYGHEKDPNQFPDGGQDAYLVLFGSFVGLIACFGIPNSLGAIESYVAAHQLKDIKSSNVSWVFSIHLGVMYIGGVLFGEFFDRFGARIPLVVGALFMCGGFMCVAESNTLVQFILSFGVMTALGTSISMAPLIGVLSHWFLKKRGFVISSCTAGGLIGSSIFPVMLQKLYGQVGFAWAMRIFSFICLFCMLVSIAFVKERKRKVTENNPNNSKAEEFKDFIRGAFDFSLLKNAKFVTLTFSVFVSEIISLTTLTYLSSYALNHSISESKAYLLITIVNVSGIPSRLISGYFSDLYGRFNMMVFTSILTTIVIFAVWLPAKSHLAVLYVFAVLFGISTSAVLSLIGPCCGQICSVDKFGKVYGFMYFHLAYLTILGMYCASLVIANGSEQNYRNFVLFEGVLSVGSVGAWLLARNVSVGNRWCKF